MWSEDPVKIRNNRPLLCLTKSVISQRACRIDWVYHALTGECSRVCSYLRMNGYTLFICDEDHDPIEGGTDMTIDKKTWAEDLLRQKHKELGRLPTKKDFDHADCSKIKAYLGPWPRALESAGLKLPKSDCWMQSFHSGPHRDDNDLRRKHHRSHKSIHCT